MPTLLKTKKPYTGVMARPKEREYNFKLAGRTKLAFALLDPQKSDVVLDVGCKGGWLEHALNNKVQRIFAFDLDESYITHNQQNNTQQNVEYVLGDATKPYPFEDAIFDKVALLEVIEHVPVNTEPAVFEEINRVLKTGGRLIVTTPAWHWFTILCDPAYWLIGHRHYRVKDMEQFLSTAGFSTVRVQRKGGIFDALSVILYYLSRPVHLENFFGRLLTRPVAFEYRQKRGFNHLIIEAIK